MSLFVNRPLSPGPGNVAALPPRPFEGDGTYVVETTSLSNDVWRQPNKNKNKRRDFSFRQILCLFLLLSISLVSFKATTTWSQFYAYTIERKTESLSVTPPVIRVHVYGGSVTVGTNLDERNPGETFTTLDNRYTAVLSKLLGPNTNIQVTNKGLRAAGPRHWIECGIEPADIIISEYRLNEHSGRILRQWYDLTHKMAKHVVILDLWSWLEPPDGLVGGPTIGAANSIRADWNQPYSYNTTFSILSLAQRDATSWRNKVAEFFDYGHGPDAYQPIAKACHDSVFEKTDQEREILRSCRQNHANAMQHGRAAYHADIANALAQHLADHVLPVLGERQQPVHRPQSSLCFGEWGLGGKERPSDSLHPWNASVIVYNETRGFEQDSVWPKRPEKISLHSNSTSTMLTLTCPTNGYYKYKSMLFGYIVHSDTNESASFLANCKQMSTHMNSRVPHIRIRRYSKLLSLPVVIKPLDIGPDAYIEITDVVCNVAEVKDECASQNQN
jgi:hypothetical protein